MIASEKGSSKADTLVKVVLVFFISLLSFSVGTFVGKQVSDSDHRRMALEGEYKVDRQVASTEKAEGDSSEKISDKEVEHLTEEFVNKEKAAGPAEEVAATEEEHSEKAEHAEKSEHADAAGYKTYARGEKKEAAHKEAPAHKEAKSVKEVAEKVAEGEAPTDGKAEERKPASVLPSVPGSAVGKYTVQVESFADEKEAKNRAADLKGKGWNSFYFPAQVNGKTWYRVSVGLFSNVKNANEFRAQFMKEANTKSAIVQKVIQ